MEPRKKGNPPQKRVRKIASQWQRMRTDQVSERATTSGWNKKIETPRRDVSKIY